MFGFLFRLTGRIVGFAARVVIFGAALVAVAGAVAYGLFDGEQYKKQLSQRAVDLTGRVLQVDGPAELQLSFPPRIVLHDVRLKNARWGTRSDMARIKRVEIQVNPLSAVSGGDSVAQVRLEGADVLLETSPQGIGNWEMAAIAAAPVAAGTLSALGLFGNTPPPVSVSDATITFRDGATGRVQTAALGSNSITLGNPVSSLAAGASVNFSAGPAVGGPAVGAAGGLAAGSPSAVGAEAGFAGAAAGSRAVAAATSDNTNPCDGTPQQTQQSRTQPRSR
jgi:uncharacterized protein involved in outer membrane biogenesis